MTIVVDLGRKATKQTKIMVILRAAICSQSSMVYLASAFAVDIKQEDITKCNQGRVESALRLKVHFWYLEAVHSNHARLVVDR